VSVCIATGRSVVELTIGVLTSNPPLVGEEPDIMYAVTVDAATVKSITPVICQVPTGILMLVMFAAVPELKLTADPDPTCELSRRFLRCS